jgi:toxin YoeB
VRCTLTCTIYCTSQWYCGDSKDAQGSPFEGIGKPEALKHSLSGCWSRRIDETKRLVYEVQDEELVIISCRYHY